MTPEDPLLGINGCPVADGEAPCLRGCGGGFPGTLVTTDKLRLAVQSENFHPERLGCGPLVENGTRGQQILQKQKE